MSKARERLRTTNVRRDGSGVRLTQTIEVEEVISINEIHGRLRSEERNLAMYEQQAKKTRARIEQYREILAEHYGAPRDADEGGGEEEDGEGDGEGEA